jgi:hypothetical protein
LRCPAEHRSCIVKVMGYTAERTIPMPLMLGELYAALKSANVSDDQARRAAEEVAGSERRLSHIESDLALLKWMVATTAALGLGNLWLSFSILGRLPR